MQSCSLGISGNVSAQSVERSLPILEPSQSSPLIILSNTLTGGSLCPILRSALDPDAVSTIQRLTREGFRTYLVGGCVRDLLLGKIPKDFDVATSARPRQIKKVCRNSRIVGRRFRLVHVHFRNNKVIEVSTFRSIPADSEPEPEEEDAERDLLITRDNTFGNEEEDAKRRDFTINGLLFEVESDTIVDYVGGVEDLRLRILRTIGDPVRRMREDPVRILRAIKFVTRLNLTLDPELAAAMAECHEDLIRSAAPRVFEELLRMLGGPMPGRAIQLLGRLGILWLLIPELNLRPNAEGEDERMERLVKRLNVLGELDRGQRSFSTPLYYATLLYDEAIRRVADRDRESAELLDEFLGPFAVRARLSRRDTARLRAMFQAFKRIDPQLAPRRSKRRRRVATQDFVRRDFFADALTLFRIVTQAEGRDPQALEHWEQQFENRDTALEEAGERHDPAPAPDNGSPRKHRRRRRRHSRSSSHSSPAD